MSCSICKSRFSNKSTCPIDGHYENWLNHPNACLYLKYQVLYGKDHHRKMTCSVVLDKIIEVSKEHKGNNKCSYCGSVGVNSASCPDNPQAKNIEWALHLNSKKKFKKNILYEEYDFDPCLLEKQQTVRRFAPLPIYT